MPWHITPVSVASAIGMFMSTGFFAVAVSTSLTVIPALMLARPAKSSSSERTLHAHQEAQKPFVAPHHLARQWKVIYDHGRKAGPFTAGLGCASWIYVAIVHFNNNTKVRNLYLAGSMFLIGVVPFTSTIMRNSVAQLSAQAESIDDEKRLEKASQSTERHLSQPTEALLKEWAQQNLVRGLLPLCGMVCVTLANL